jgi:hypothetical protein
MGRRYYPGICLNEYPHCRQQAIRKRFKPDIAVNTAPTCFFHVKVGSELP